MTVTRRLTGRLFRGCHCCAANQRGNNECCGILHSGLLISLCYCCVENKTARIPAREVLGNYRRQSQLKRDSAWAGCQPPIRKGERSRLWTRMATESVLSCEPMKSWRRFCN